MSSTNPSNSGESPDEQTVVLHVDDDVQFLEMAAEILEDLEGSRRIISESNPETALSRLKEEPVDVVISDYDMPQKDGIEFLKEVRSHFPELPFFLLTGKGSEQVASDAIDAGVTSYVQKSGNEVFEQLVNRIDSAMERRRSEQKARMANRKLLDLYEQSDGFYILDEDWTISYWNDRIEERTGVSKDEVLGKNYWGAFPHATDTEIRDNFEHAMEVGEPVEFEVYYEPFSNWVEIRTYPMDDGLFVHSRDISEEKERENELERRNHIIRSFANTVSHDLRNPLSLAEGRLRLAQETGDFEHLEEVARAHNRMRNLIDELLRLARGEKLELTTISLRQISEDAWETVSSGEAEIVVESDFSFEGHENQIRRLLENLFWNAIDHGSASVIRVDNLDGRGFCVEDNGSGIPDEDLGNVFKSGFSTDDESPGYGLSIVRGIIDMHNWDIGILEGDSGGARFEITCPGENSAEKTDPAT